MADTTIEKFLAAYSRLADEGMADRPGGLEYQYVLKGWRLAGSPTSGLEEFIATRADCSADGQSLADNN